MGGIPAISNVVDKARKYFSRDEIRAKNFIFYMNYKKDIREYKINLMKLYKL